MARAHSIFVMAALAVAAPSLADEPAANSNEMYANISRCIGSIAIAPGSELSVLFSLNRRGGIIGKPRLNIAHWGGDKDSERQAAAALVERLDHCFPVAITDKFGSLLAGHLFVLRLRQPPANPLKT